VKYKEYNNAVFKLKNDIVDEINKITKELEIPGELEYVELPIRIPLLDHFGNESEEYILAIQKNEAIINSMFNDSKPKLLSLSIETLINILEQVQKYKDENV